MALSLTRQGRQLIGSLGQRLGDHLTVMAREVSPQFEGRFVQVGLNHQIAILKQVLFIGRGEMPQLVDQPVQPTEGTLRSSLREQFRGGTSLSQLDQKGGPIQTPATASQGLVNLSIFCAGRGYQPGGGLMGDVELGGYPIAHRAGAVGGVDLIPVKFSQWRACRALSREI